MSRGVLWAPEIIPIPAEVDRPMRVKNKPMPAVLAILRDAGISVTSH